MLVGEPGDGDVVAVADVGGEDRDASAAAQHGAARAADGGHPLDRDGEVEEFLDTVGRDESGLALNGVPDLSGTGQ